MVDAPEWRKEYSAEIDLKAGDHPLEIYFIQYGGGINFNVHYQGPDTDGKKTAIPGHRLMLPESVPLLRYEYYEPAKKGQQYKKVPDFRSMQPSRNGFAHKFTLGTIPGLGEHSFAVTIWGYLRIEASGNYTFFAVSDDGCILSIDDKEYYCA